MPRKEKWIQPVHPKKGALHRQLDYPSNHPLPPGLIKEIQGVDIGTHVRGHTVTPKLKRRVNFMMNIRGPRERR